MKTLDNLKKVMFTMLMLLIVSACDDTLSEINENPNGIDPSTANPNLLMPTVLSSAAQEYLGLGFGNMAGTVQHTQKDGWFTSHNQYDWDTDDGWENWYSMLRTNELLVERAVELEYPFFEGVGLTMRSFVFGNIADIWGDAPYTIPLNGEWDGTENQFPVFDSQQEIYEGIIADLSMAASIFETAETDVVNSNADLYFGGDAEMWQRFANSLLLRYYMRLSEKMPDMARQGIEEVYATGMYLQSAADDVTLDYTGGSSDVWPSMYTDVSSFTRWQACQTLVDQLVSTNDPRVAVWFEPVAVQWVADPSLTFAADTVLRIDGEPVADGALAYSYERFQELGDTQFTRLFNPNEVTYDTSTYVGLPPALVTPESYNGNPVPGQGTLNQHVSQLAPIYATAGSAGDILKARIISAAEVSFIFAEAALKGWNVGTAEEHYNAGVENSLETWGEGDGYDDFIAGGDVAYNGTLEQIITQKWVASWTAATESWMDYKRVGYPLLEVGPASNQPVVAVRYPYGSDELNNNTANVNSAIERLEVTNFSGAVGANSPWSKPWLLQGTSSPW